MNHRSRRRLLSAGLLFAAFAPGCGPEPPAATPVSGAPTPQAPAAQTPVQPAGAEKAKAGFQNPGGMWMPEQLAGQADQLEAAGFQLDAKALTDPTAFPLNAVISLGGCSASFVSPDGLVATNHHCSVGALQYNATPKEDLLKDGYVAKTRATERWAGPTARVFVTQAFRDVTGEVRQGLEALKSGIERHKAIEDRTKKLIAACEKDRPGIRCSVAEYFGGAEFKLIEQLEIKDVRMVYIPPDGVGNYGGDIDNWRWPRHGGDFAFFRAYVGKDGKPADHADTNVPYRPKSHLKLASAPLQQGDFVMVAGYPARTNRLRTAAEVESAVGWEYPTRVKLFQEVLAILGDISKKDAAARIKVSPTMDGLSNNLIKTQGLLDGLVKGGLAKKKTEIEGQLQTWIAGDAGRKAAYGDVLEKMAKLHADQQKTREHDALLGGSTWLVKLIGAGDTIVRMAEERAKPDAERDPDFQERNWQRIEQGQARLQKSYDRTADIALFKLFLQRMAKLPEKDRPALFALVLGGKEPTDATIDQALGALYGKTKIEDQATRTKLIKTATTAELQRSQDPLIQLALKLRPALKALADRDKAYHGAMSTERPRYIEALRKFQGGALAPDANGTLRVTYGTVRGYRPTPDAPEYRPFTPLSEVVKKNTGKEPFEAPPGLLAAVNAKKVGPYVDASLGDVPVNFLSDLDITGGNSGSATLNARGELVGLAFDGNYESMASDWLFMPSVTRTIHVDLRYMMWVMDSFGGADHVLTEMGAKPAID